MGLKSDSLYVSLSVPFLTIAICLLYVFQFVPASFGQDAVTDPFEVSQQELSARISQEWQKMLDGCTRLARPPFDTEAKVQQYLECVFGNFPHYFRFWAEQNKENLNGVKQGLHQLMLQQIPQEENSAAERQNTSRAAVYTHQRLAAWHQRMAELANSLMSINFFVRSEAEDVLNEIQSSINDCTGCARTFVEELNSDKTYSEEELQQKCDEFFAEVFEPPVRVIDKFLITMLNATDRAERQYPTFLQRASTDYREFAKGYNEFFSKIIFALNSCAASLWEMPQTK